MKPKRQSAPSAGSVEFTPSASAACSIKLAFIAIINSRSRSRSDFRDAGQRVLADFGGKCEDPVEQRISGFGQIQQVGTAILWIGPALDQPRRLQPIEQPR